MNNLKRLILAALLILPIASVSSLKLLTHAEQAEVTNGKAQPGDGSGATGRGTITSQE